MLTDRDTLKRLLLARLMPPLSARVVAFKAFFRGGNTETANPVLGLPTSYSLLRRLGPSSLTPLPPRGPLGNAEGHRQVLPITSHLVQSLNRVQWP